MHSLALRSPRSSQPVMATHSSQEGVGRHLLPPGRLPRQPGRAAGSTRLVRLLGAPALPLSPRPRREARGRQRQHLPLAGTLSWLLTKQQDSWRGTGPPALRGELSSRWSLAALVEEAQSLKDQVGPV